MDYASSFYVCLSVSYTRVVRTYLLSGGNFKEGGAACEDCCLIDSVSARQ